MHPRTPLLLACIWVGWGHSCHAHYGHHHCHDHDHDHHCDDDEGTAGDPDEGGWTVGGWERLERALEPGRHPVARVRGCRGVRLDPAVAGDPLALFEAAARIVAANPDLLGLPVGGFVPVGVRFEVDGVRVALVQSAHGWPVPGGEGGLRFDLAGELTEVVNRGWLLPGY